MRSRKALAKLSQQSSLSLLMIFKLSITCQTVILLSAATFKSDSSVYVFLRILQQMSRNRDNPASQKYLAHVRTDDDRCVDGQILFMLHAFIKIWMLSANQYSMQKNREPIFVSLRKLSVLLLRIVQMRFISKSDFVSRNICLDSLILSMSFDISDISKHTYLRLGNS